MENTKNSKQTEQTDNEQDKIENPQKSTQPTFNSTTSHRDSEALPAIENLNQKNELDDELKSAKNGGNVPSAPKNDESLHGKNSKTDLGNGQRDQDEEEDEKIIRT